MVIPTFEELIEEIKPIATKLVEIPDEKLPHDALIIKSLLCIVMTLGEQIPPVDRDRATKAIAFSIAPIFDYLVQLIP